MWSDDASGTSGNPEWARPKEFWPIVGHVVATGSAHPVRRPGTNTWVGIISEMGAMMPWGKHYIDFFTFDGDQADLQPRKKVGRVGPLKKPGYVHSFGVTHNYFVLPLSMGLGHDFEGRCRGPADLLCSIVGEWQGIHVVDQQSGNVTIFEAEPFMHVHILNAFENATGDHPRRQRVRGRLAILAYRRATESI